MESRVEGMWGERRSPGQRLILHEPLPSSQERLPVGAGRQQQPGGRRSRQARATTTGLWVARPAGLPTAQDVQGGDGGALGRAQALRPDFPSVPLRRTFTQGSRPRTDGSREQFVTSLMWGVPKS